MGSFGRVKLSKNKTNNKYSAVKILKKYEILKLKQQDHIKSELEILSLIDHPFMIDFQGLGQDDRYIYIVMELV